MSKGWKPIDLGQLGNDFQLARPTTQLPVDNTGLPRPTRATVTMTSGIQFDVVPVFGGWQNGKRRYRLVIESDWGAMKVASIGVDRWPPDVSINLSLPDDWPDEKCVEFGTGIRFYEQGDPHRTAMRLDRGNETR